MKPEQKKFLFDLLQTPSPSGYEKPVQKLVKQYLKSSVDALDVDLYGNVIAGVNPKAPLRVVLSGHADQIGLMVKYINKDGFITLGKLGGVDGGVLPGARIAIYSKKGPVIGVVGRKPIHLQQSDERERMKIDVEKFWVDIGARSQREAEARVEVGDPATFELSVLEMPHQVVSAPGLDDKVGLFTAVETLRRLAKDKLQVAVYAVSSVQEELGVRGIKTATYAIDPQVGIAIDVVHATDSPSHDGVKGPSLKLGKGPALSTGPGTNPVLEALIWKAAKKLRIPLQKDPHERPLGNDAREMQISRAGVATAAIGIPNRYMHTQAEICSLDDIDNAVEVLVETIKGIKKGQDFRPV